MTEQEAKAIKWMINVRDYAVATLDHIAKNEPNVSPMLYAGRKGKADAILNAFDELEQYRALGTVEELAGIQNGYFTLSQKVRQYEKLGTVEELRKAMEKQDAKIPDIWGDGYDDKGNMIYDMYDCPNCGESYEIDYGEYDFCPKCGQAIDRSGIQEGEKKCLK